MVQPLRSSSGAGLMRLEMGEDVTHIIRGGIVRPIAPMEEVKALQVKP